MRHGRDARRDVPRAGRPVRLAVVSLDYPRAPESRFPEPLEACWRALQALGEAGLELDTDFTRGSHAANGADYFLTTDMMRWFWAQYLGEDPASPAASPRRCASATSAGFRPRPSSQSSCGGR